MEIDNSFFEVNIFDDKIWNKLKNYNPGVFSSICSLQNIQNNWVKYY